MTGTSYKLSQRSERRGESPKEGITDHFVVGDIDSILIEGIINVLNICRGGKGVFFRMWECRLQPFNLQWPKLENGGANFYHCLLVDSMQ